MKQALVLVGLMLVMLVSRVAGAVPVVKDEEKGILVNVGVLVQPQFQMTMPGSDGAGPGPCGSATRNRCSAGIGNARGDGPAFDFFLRRARIMVWGSATKELSFFVDTDEPNLGKGGSFATSTFIQDAFLSYKFMPELSVDAGLFLIPLSHHTLEGATSLNALDYHSDMIRFPTGRIFRDVGVQVRGLALQDHLHYRLAITEGVRNGVYTAAAPPHSVINPGSVPRVTAQIRGNILGSEPDFFFKGIYFSDKPIITVGVGADWQSKSTFVEGRVRDYFAANVDAFVEYPFTAQDELIFKGSFFLYGEGSNSLAGVPAVPATATTPAVAAIPAFAYPGSTSIAQGASAFYAEAGFRHAFIEPIVFLETLKARKEALSILAPHIGVNLWIMKHNFNLKTDVGYKRTEAKGAATKKDIAWTTQAQVFF